jgi:hypothetical protein
MAFADGTLVAITNSNKNAGNVWFYKEAATLAAIRASGYFDSAVDYGMVDGDIVMLAGSDGFGFNDISVSGSTYTVGEAITSA